MSIDFNILIDYVTIISLLASIIVAIVAIIALILTSQGNKQNTKNALRESSDIIFQQWLSEDMRSFRRYFFNEFLPLNARKLNGKSLNEIDKVIEDKGRTRKLCDFFDKLGWLGAAGLIDVDYVLGPMHHAMRRIWITLEPLILNERKFKFTGSFDPIFLDGFEWLYKYSCLPGKDQASIIGRIFTRPMLRSKSKIEKLRKNLNVHERIFLSDIGSEKKSIIPETNQINENIEKTNCSLVIIENQQDDILLYLRDDKPNIPYPNTWAILGGLCEKGENPEQVIKRELREELIQKDGEDIELSTLRFIFSQERDDIARVEHVFRLLINQSSEHFVLVEGQKLKFFKKSFIRRSKKIAPPHKKILLRYISTKNISSS